VKTVQQTVEGSNSVATVMDRSVKVTFPKDGPAPSEADIQRRLSVFGKISNVSYGSFTVLLYYFLL
jgi:predicted transcriptional regulator